MEFFLVVTWLVAYILSAGAVQPIGGDLHYYDWDSTLADVLSNRTAWESFNLKQYGVGFWKGCRNCTDYCAVATRFGLVTNYDDAFGVVLHSDAIKYGNCSNSGSQDYAYITIDHRFDFLVDYIETSIASGCNEPNNTVEFCLGRSLWVNHWDDIFSYPSSVYIDAYTNRTSWYFVHCLSPFMADGSPDDSWSDTEHWHSYCSDSEMEPLLADWLNYTLDSSENTGMPLGAGATWAMCAILAAITFVAVFF